MYPQEAQDVADKILTLYSKTTAHMGSELETDLWSIRNDDFVKCYHDVFFKFEKWATNHLIELRQLQQLEQLCTFSQSLDCVQELDAVKQLSLSRNKLQEQLQVDRRSIDHDINIFKQLQKLSVDYKYQEFLKIKGDFKSSPDSSQSFASLLREKGNDYPLNFLTLAYFYPDNYQVVTPQSLARDWGFVLEQRAKLGEKIVDSIYQNISKNCGISCVAGLEHPDAGRYRLFGSPTTNTGASALSPLAAPFTPAQKRPEVSQSQPATAVKLLEQLQGLSNSSDRQTTRKAKIPPLNKAV